MKKSKFIVDADRKKYLKNLEDLMNKTNPKPDKKQREAMKKMYLEMRNLPY